jgi:hypothetical protein
VQAESSKSAEATSKMLNTPFCNNINKDIPQDLTRLYCSAAVNPKSLRRRVPHLPETHLVIAKSSIGL